MSENPYRKEKAFGCVYLTASCGRWESSESRASSDLWMHANIAKEMRDNDKLAVVELV